MSKGAGRAKAKPLSGDRMGRLKRWLMDAYGNGETVACAMQVSPDCLRVMTINQVTLDKHPVPGYRGGKYNRRREERAMEGG